MDRLFKFILSTGEVYQISFQGPCTTTMEGIFNFHNDLMFFIVVIGVFVLWILVSCYLLNSNLFFSKYIKNYCFVNNNVIANFILKRQDFDLYRKLTIYNLRGSSHNTLLEIIWTFIPALILAVIAIPSFGLLYSIEEFVEPTLTVKVTGHQWYWCYEYSNVKKTIVGEHINGYKFESYMIPTENLEKGNLRLLEVDNRLILPIKTHIQILVTAADVLHCWAVPALGIKIDACPGRLNQNFIYIKVNGVFYGQCSEICGINHGFMPIVVQSVSIYDFLLKSYAYSIVSDFDGCKALTIK